LTAQHTPTPTRFMLAPLHHQQSFSFTASDNSLIVSTHLASSSPEDNTGLSSISNQNIHLTVSSFNLRYSTSTSLTYSSTFIFLPHKFKIRKMPKSKKRIAEDPSDDAIDLEEPSIKKAKTTTRSEKVKGDTAKTTKSRTGEGDMGIDAEGNEYWEVSSYSYSSFLCKKKNRFFKGVFIETNVVCSYLERSESLSPSSEACVWWVFGSTMKRMGRRYLEKRYVCLCVVLRFFAISLFFMVACPPYHTVSKSPNVQNHFYTRRLLIPNIGYFTTNSSILSLSQLATTD
jgi:hypothetical protein